MDPKYKFRGSGQISWRSLSRRDCIIPWYCKNPSVTYLSSTSVSDIIDAMRKPIEEELLSSLRDAKYFVLLADESTDEAYREQFSIMCKWVHKNEVKEHDIGMIHVEKTDAFSLMVAIEQFFVAKNVDLAYDRFLGFDGINTMSGKVTGNYDSKFNFLK